MHRQLFCWRCKLFMKKIDRTNVRAYNLIIATLGTEINTSYFPLAVLIAKEMIQIWCSKKVHLRSSLKAIVLSEKLSLLKEQATCMLLNLQTTTAAFRFVAADCFPRGMRQKNPFQM